MNLIWLTDIHLNFLDIDTRLSFYHEIKNSNGDAVMITGDIAEAPSIVDLLTEMNDEIQKPIYFVLGNHDYYHSPVETVKIQMINLTKEKSLLNWLPASGIHLLQNNTILLGQDGWADGRHGDYVNSPVSLNDSRMITDLFHAKILGKYKLLEKMQQLADDDAAKLNASIHDAIIQYHPKKIIILTHIPPFKEASFHEGKMNTDYFSPFFTSKATGDVLLESAKKYSGIEFLVLCGHTHAEANYQAADNLIIKVGGAVYCQPGIVEIIRIE